MPGWKILGAQVRVGAEVRRSRWVVHASGGTSLTLGEVGRHPGSTPKLDCREGLLISWRVLGRTPSRYCVSRVLRRSYPSFAKSPESLVRTGLQARSDKV